MLVIVYLILNIKTKTFSGILKNFFFRGFSELFNNENNCKIISTVMLIYIDIFLYFVFILKNDLKKIFQLYHMFIIWKWYFKQRNYTFSANGELWSLKTEDICSLIFYNLLFFSFWRLTSNSILWRDFGKYNEKKNVQE